MSGDQVLSPFFFHAAFHLGDHLIFSSSTWMMKFSNFRVVVAHGLHRLDWKHLLLYEFCYVYYGLVGLELGIFRM